MTTFELACFSSAVGVALAEAVVVVVLARILASVVNDSKAQKPNNGPGLLSVTPMVHPVEMSFDLAPREPKPGECEGCGKPFSDVTAKVFAVAAGEEGAAVLVDCECGLRTACSIEQAQQSLPKQFEIRTPLSTPEQTGARSVPGRRKPRRNTQSFSENNTETGPR